MNSDLSLFIMCVFLSIGSFIFGYGRMKLHNNQPEASVDLNSLFKKTFIKLGYVMAVLALINLAQYIWL